MDMFELNKFAGALLGSLLFVVVMHHTVDGLLEPKELEEPAYKVAVEGGEDQAAATSEQPKKEMNPMALLATADADAGRKIFKKCGACHNIDKGGKNKVGPDLYGIIGADRARRSDFSYSDAMKEKGGKWTYEDLAKFLHSPKDFIPGTKMTFAGLKKPQDIADVIAYLRTMNDSPPPLPAAQ